jgi:enoyl-CoA hydratase/carnithine racemase
VAYEEILYEVSGPVATIFLNRPDRLNALTSTMERELRSAVEAAEADSNVRAIVITGAGRGFCAGVDMEVLSTDPEQKPESSKTKARATTQSEAPLESNYEKRLSYLLRIKKPILAAINGPIAGFGVCISLFCDLRYMADTAKLTTSFARRGLIAEHGISWMLPRLIGPMNALDLLFSARSIDAAEVGRIGLARVLPNDGFLASVQQSASDLAHLSSPRSIEVIKRQVYDSLFQPLSEAWDIADEEMAKSLKTEDFKEGVAHFLEKRRPAFTGN